MKWKEWSCKSELLQKHNFAFKAQLSNDFVLLPSTELIPVLLLQTPPQAEGLWSHAWRSKYLLPEGQKKSPSCPSLAGHQEDRQVPWASVSPEVCCHCRKLVPISHLIKVKLVPTTPLKKNENEFINSCLQWCLWFVLCLIQARVLRLDCRCFQGQCKYCSS